MEVHILAIQARVLLWVGVAWIALGLWLGYDPTTVAWRAALGAVLAMWVVGKLMHIVVGVINERMAADLAEREAEAEKRAAAAAAAAASPAPAANAGAAQRVATRPVAAAPARPRAPEPKAR